MKLYIWRDVLTDYTSGVIFAVARTEHEARGKVIRAWLRHHNPQTPEARAHDLRRITAELDSVKPTARNAAGWCYGGG